ncbi:MAG: ribosome silencing factor [Desulfovibrio sp.]|jgi:ribosome-associated protein|nr:ribosome silencing factor [Desulfovibrio sp.]
MTQIVSPQDKLSRILPWLEEHKAQDIVSIDLAGRGAFTDILVVLTAGSPRHGRGLADGIAALCGEHGYEFLNMAGYELGQWILVDLNDIVVNIFLAPAREAYRLETLWGHAKRDEAPHDPDSPADS